MATLASRFDRIDKGITRWMAENGILLLRLSLGANFLWFGVLKFFPGQSSAESLAESTIAKMTLGFVPPPTGMFVLAVWESLIGVGLLTAFFLRGTLLLLWVQMLGTMTPLFLFPETCFTTIPLVPTLEGQYIIKNLVLISAGIVMGATVRGGRLTPR